jgi:hypothetical protein
MRCPFCAESIHEDAILCPHCKSNFAPLKPLLARVETLESENAELRSELSRAIREIQAKSSTREQHQPFSKPILVPVLLAWIVGIWALTRDSEQSSILFFLGIWGTPLGLGIWLGYKLDGVRIRLYAAIGTLWCLTILTRMAVSRGDLTVLFQVFNQGLTLPALAFGLPILACIGGGFIGDWCEMRFGPVRSSTVQPEIRLARSILGPDRTKGAAGESRTARLATLLEWAKLLAGLLTVILSGIFSLLVAQAGQ